MEGSKRKGKQRVELTDGKGIFMEPVRSKKERGAGFLRIMGAYCGKPKTAMGEDG